MQEIVSTVFVYSTTQLKSFNDSTDLVDLVYQRKAFNKSTNFI